MREGLSPFLYISSIFIFVNRASSLWNDTQKKFNVPFNQAPEYAWSVM